MTPIAMVMLNLHLPIAGLIPSLILLAAVSIGYLLRKRRGDRSPLPEKLLRPAGYGLQRKLEGLNDSFNFWFMGAFVFSLLIAVFPETRPTDAWAPLTSLMIFGPVAAVCSVVALRQLYKIRAYRRGLLGEQAMAELLQPLFADGYRIFHDISGNGKWNIDHVVVGPAGVFAIETKYRTKRPGRNGGPDHKAMFDGNRIEFASGDYDAEAPSQASRNAQWLAVELSKATGERVTVRPVVALPGWWVDRTAKSDITVLSGKEVADFIAKESAKLSDKVIQQISYQLEQRCRDVEI